MHRVLVVGVGSIGERHVRCLLATARATVGICEVQEVLRWQVARRYGLDLAFGTLEQALTEPWDAAVVATPAHTHIPIARTLADAGRAVLVEKPLSVNLEGVPELLARVHEKNLVVRVGYTYRAHPGLRDLKRALDEGRFGVPLQITLTAGQPFALFRPAYRQTYFADRAHGGGAIQDALTHFVDLGQWLAGPIERVMVDADRQAIDGVTVEDTVHLLARHGAVMGCYCLNMYQTPNELTLTIVCTRATARFELHKNRWRWMTEPDGQWHNESVDVRDRDDWFVRQEVAFLDAAEGQPTWLCSLAESVQTLRVSLAILAASEQPCWQSIPDPAAFETGGVVTADG